jgi:hypothetical protein
MNFPSKNRNCPLPQGPCHKVEGLISLRGRASEHIFWMELSQMSPQIVRNKTPQRPLESQLKTQKWRIVLARQNLLLQKGAGTHGTACTKGQGSLLPLVFLTQLPLPLDLDWSRSKVPNLLDWLKFYTNLGEG